MEGDLKGSRKTVKIGVCGIHTGAGATHVSHMIALYLSGCRRRRVAVAEGDAKASFRYLERYLSGNSGEGHFLMRRCTYRYDMADWEDERADYMVYDAGSGPERRNELLFSSDICIAIGNGGIFGGPVWEDFFQSREVRERIRLRGLKDWRFLENHSRTGKSRTLILHPGEEEQKIKVYGLGAEENLLHLSKQAQSLMEKMDI